MICIIWIGNLLLINIVMNFRILHTMLQITLHVESIFLKLAYMNRSIYLWCESKFKVAFCQTYGVHQWINKFLWVGMCTYRKTYKLYYNIICQVVARILVIWFCKWKKYFVVTERVDDICKVYYKIAMWF